MAEPRTHTFIFKGGLDVVTQALVKKESTCISAENYEPVPNGYRRIYGHERFDGHPQPHLAKYYYLTFDAGQAAISEGDAVVGGTSNATGVALIDAVIESGSYGGSDAAGYLVLRNVVGTFSDNEALEVSASAKMVLNGVLTEASAPNDTLASDWMVAAIEAARDDISEVPGSGRLRGAWRYNNTVYAFRDNIGGTACDMYKSSSSGWALINKGKTLDFTAGRVTAFLEGETVTGGTSSATGTVKRVVVQSGSFSTSDAAGYLVIQSDTGTFQAAETITTDGGGSGTCSGAAAATSLEPGGRFQFITDNFYGNSSSKRMYGVDGVSKAFEFDGTTFTPIRTGMTTDTPRHIAAFKKHLFLAFPGGSLQHSAIGSPLEWSVVLGAAELGVGSDITGILPDISGVMAVYSKSKIHILYGSSSADWNLKGLSGRAGAFEWAAQEIAGQAIHVDINGVGSLETVQNFGDFQIGKFSKKVDPWFLSKRAAAESITATTRIKSTNQYRIFYSGGTGMVMDMSSGLPQFLPISYGKTIYYAGVTEDDDGEEWILFGSDDGYVYRDGAGNNFDGESITAFVRFAFTHFGSPQQNKRYIDMLLEMEASPNTVLSIASEYDYGSTELPAQMSTEYNVVGGGGFWDEAFWNEFYWSTQLEGIARADLEGIGKNIGIVVASDLTYEPPHTLHGATLSYTFRGRAK